MDGTGGVFAVTELEEADIISVNDTYAPMVNTEIGEELAEKAENSTGPQNPTHTDSGYRI